MELYHFTDLSEIISLCFGLVADLSSPMNLFLSAFEFFIAGRTLYSVKILNSFECFKIAKHLWEAYAS